MRTLLNDRIRTEIIYANNDENKKKGVIEFNNKLSEEERNKLEILYLHYHKPAVCYKWKYKRLKRIKNLLDSLSHIFILAGGIAGSVTLNPIVLSTLSGFGAVIQGYLKRSGSECRIERCKMAEKEYEKVLSSLKGLIRGLQYEETTLLSHLEGIDEVISSNCPSFDVFVKKYKNKEIKLKKSKALEYVYI